MIIVTQQETTTQQVTLPSLEDERSIWQIVDLLFIYTDQKEWAKAGLLFIDGLLDIDMR